MRQAVFVVAGAVTFFVICVGVWLVLPYSTIDRMMEAAQRGDAHVLSSHVNWTAVRQNASFKLKSCASELVNAPSVGDVGAVVRGVLGAALDVFAERAVDRVVSVEAIAALISTQPSRSVTTGTAPSQVQHSVEWKATDRVQLLVTNGGRGAPLPRLELRRQGVSWQVDHVLFDCPIRL